MVSARLWVLAALTASIASLGCSLDRGGFGDDPGDGAQRLDGQPARETSLPMDSASDGGSDEPAIDGGPPAPFDAALDGTTDTGPRDAGTDTGATDTGPLDTGPPDLGPPDLGPPDLGPPDLGPPDLGPPDLGPPDLGPPDMGPPSCNSIYGGAGGYILCVQRPTECEFFTRHSTGGTCTRTCTTYGGSCVRRWRDTSGAGNECVHLDSTSRVCDTPGNDSDICVCTRR